MVTVPPSNITLTGFTEGCAGKPQPCWYGIEIGVTTLSDAVDILQARGYHIQPMGQQSFDVPAIEGRSTTNSACSIQVYRKAAIPVANLVSVHYCPGLLVGDILREFGNAQVNSYCSRFGLVLFNLIDVPNPRYPDNMITAQTRVRSLTDALSPYHRIESVVFGAGLNDVADTPTLWNGFAPKWHYCPGWRALMNR
jgi:hypothetical protein